MTSRFKVTGAPDKQPGVDFVTGTGVGPFIDTGRDVRDSAGRLIGRVYLSENTVAEMARELGLISKPADDVALQAAYNRGKLDGLKEELGGDLYSIADTLRRWLEHVAPGDDSAGNVSA